jgi:transposase-like protein
MPEETKNASTKHGPESESSAEITVEGKYRCRQCGKVFNSLEEHDDHRRKAHDLPIFQPIVGMAL